MADPFISICVPAYQRVFYLERLLESIMLQDYYDFEVVVTDDSPDRSVSESVNRYQERLPIRYYKNDKALGTPENWNEGIRQAKGEWIKIMHDDDWFADGSGLGIFARAVASHPEAHFIFSAYSNVRELNGASRKPDTITQASNDAVGEDAIGKNAIREVRLSPLKQRMLHATPWHLLGENYIGNPSCTLFKKEQGYLFDKNFKWVVDFEFYIRYLQAFPDFYYIDQALVNVGLNDTQVTNYTFGVTAVQVPENHLLLGKNGVAHLRNLVVYDYFWRLYRNLGIVTLAQIRDAGYHEPLPKALESMIRWQSKIPVSILKNGFGSKALMFLHYLTHFYRL